jgi:two-component sensor histidine kinase
VNDDGKGFPEDILSRKRQSVGISIIEALAKQLGGQLSMVNSHGTKVTVTIPGGAEDAG